MSFLDKLKSTAGNAMAAASDAAKNVQDKGREMTEKARLNKAIKAEETKINNLYMIMGQKLFSENETAPAGYEDQFNGIKIANSEIEKLNKELNAISSASNCPSCGAKISHGQPFCQCCGTKLTVQEAAPAHTEEAPATEPTTVEAAPSENTESNS